MPTNLPYSSRWGWGTQQLGPPWAKHVGRPWRSIAGTGKLYKSDVVPSRHDECGEVVMVETRTLDAAISVGRPSMLMFWMLWSWACQGYHGS